MSNWKYETMTAARLKQNNPVCLNGIIWVSADIFIDTWGHDEKHVTKEHKIDRNIANGKKIKTALPETNNKLSEIQISDPVLHTIVKYSTNINVHKVFTFLSQSHLPRECESKYIMTS